MTRCATRLVAVLLVCSLSASRGDESSQASKITKLEVGSATDNSVAISGPDARQQILISAEHENGWTTDATRDVKYTVEPVGIVNIDDTGLMTPLADGTCTVTATIPESPELSASVSVSVTDYTTPRTINFRNSVTPIFTKLGCNGGGCHGKSGGQNGFRLSLLGFYPDDDFEFLRKESRGRRIFPAVPSESLLLKKATGETPHGGGRRMEQDSYEYRMLVRWIEQGMPKGSAEDPSVVAIRCVPDGRTMSQGSEQQVSVLATYSDGRIEDVTRMALYEPNDSEMAECSKTGLVSTLDLAGEVAIMARYQGHVSTFRATIPLGADTSTVPDGDNIVDAAVFAKLKQLGIPPSNVCDDATFIRRVSLDITGALPTEERVRVFLADTNPEKRNYLIDELLDSRAYADHFANKWNFVLRNKKANGNDTPGMFAFHRWIWDSMYENKPYDRFVRELLTASGDFHDQPAVTWLREVDQVEEQVEDTAQLFLGLRIQCARCHHHPFEKWSQNDYYGMAAFFTRIGKNVMPGVDGGLRDRRVFHNEGVAASSNPRSGQSLRPTGLGNDTAYDIPADRDPRVVLANWMAEPENPFFAKALVNRYWKHFFSRGIVEPEDDMRETNPPTNPELLNALAAHFVESGFDMKDLVRTICRSQTYQLSSMPNEFNQSDKQNFSRYYPRRLSAEVLYDAFHQVTNTSEAFAGLPAGSKAMQIVDAASGPYFLKVFGQPQADTACECERSMQANLAQSLHLLNSKEVQDKISKDGARAALLAANAEAPAEQRIKELYLWMYSREPDADELRITTEYLASHSAEPRIAWEDIVWSLVNTKEFLFNH